jgi:hypothetical protein
MIKLHAPPPVPLFDAPSPSNSSDKMSISKSPSQDEIMGMPVFHSDPETPKSETQSRSSLQLKAMDTQEDSESALKLEMDISMQPERARQVVEIPISFLFEAT